MKDIKVFPENCSCPIYRAFKTLKSLVRLKSDATDARLFFFFEFGISYFEFVSDFALNLLQGQISDLSFTNTNRFLGKFIVIRHCSQYG